MYKTFLLFFFIFKIVISQELERIIIRDQLESNPYKREIELPCDEDCNGNGFCVNGECKCYPGYSTSNCSVKDICFTAICVNGECNPISGECMCHEGFTGERCDIIDCGNKGLYSSLSDKCICKIGYTGERCDYCTRYYTDEIVRTIVCCPTTLESNPYVPVLVKTDEIYKYTGGVMTIEPCILPNRTSKSGIKVDCSCDSVLTNVNNNNNQNMIKSRSTQMKKGLISKYSSYIESSYIIVPQLSEKLLSQSYLKFGARAENCDTLVPSSTGTDVLIAIVLLFSLSVIAGLIYLFWTSGDSPLLSKRKIIPSVEIKKKSSGKQKSNV